MGSARALACRTRRLAASNERVEPREQEPFANVWRGCSRLGGTARGGACAPRNGFLRITLYREFREEFAFLDVFGRIEPQEKCNERPPSPRLSPRGEGEPIAVTGQFRS